MELILCRVVESSCLLTHDIVPHISWPDLPYHRTTKKYENSVSMEVFQFSPRTSVIVNNIFAHFTLSLSTPQTYMIKERCWFSQIDFFIEYFPHRINVFVSFQPIRCHPHTQIRIILFHGVQKSIPNWEPSPNRVSIGFSQIAFPITVLPKDDRTDSVQEERLGLPYWTMISAICVVVDESKCLDIPILEFFLKKL